MRDGGWLINFGKSSLIPRQVGKWLGVIINTKSLTFHVPKEKIEKLLKNIKQILSHPFCSAKQLSRVAGQLAAMHLALGPIVRLFTRNLYRMIETRESWYHPISLSDEALSELKFWLHNINSKNEFTFKPRPTTSKIVFTDASSFGYGGFIAERLNRVICVGKFNEVEKATSSTTRELTAVEHVLKSFGARLAHESIQINIDNLNACHILSVGSSKQHLQSLAIDIFNHCSKFNIRLQPQWVPREENQIADYFSKFYCPNTESVNCFTNDWKNERNYLCPPIHLIGSTIRHLRLCGASGTLVVPVWTHSILLAHSFSKKSHC